MTNPNIPLRHEPEQPSRLVTAPPGEAAAATTASAPKMAARNLEFYYDKFHALKTVSLDSRREAR